MSKKKKQHFVPRFYLRNFSFQQDGKSIGVWLITSKRYIRRVSLKNQSYGNYFYGNDLSIENTFSELEKSASNIIRNITKDYILPNPDTRTKNYLHLLAFVISLSLRTRYTADVVNESADKLIKLAYKEDTSINKYLDDFIISTKDAPRIALSSLETCLLLSLDLDYKLIVNNSNRMFITSDNPVIKHNQYFINDTIRSHVGFASKGLQLIITLGPQTCLIFYDKDVYRIGNRKDSVINISNTYDVDEINRIELINADKVLYFDNSIDESYILRIVKESKRYLKTSKVVVNEIELPPLKPDEKRSLLHTRPFITQKDLSLSFVRILKKAKRNYTEDNPEMFRDPSLVDYILDNKALKKP